MKWAEIWGSTAFIKMVRDGKELSTDLKETIMGLDQEGYSACKTAEFLSLNRRTVSYIIKRYRERGTVENLPRSDRKNKANVRTDRLLLCMVKTNRRQTLGDLTSKLNNSPPYKLSQRTVQRRLHDARFKRRRITNYITIRGVNRGKRRAFCRSKYHWNAREHWSKIIFSEETQAVIGKNKKICVWGRSHETCMPQCLGQYGDQDRQSAVSVLLWGCITYKAVGKFVPVEGNMNSEEYI